MLSVPKAGNGDYQSSHRDHGAILREGITELILKTYWTWDRDEARKWQNTCSRHGQEHIQRPRVGGDKHFQKSEDTRNPQSEGEHSGKTFMSSVK